MTPNDREDRQLADIEQHLAEEDPDLARRFTRFRSTRISSVAAGVLGVLVLLPAGLITMVVGVQHGSPVAIVGGAIVTAVVPVMMAWYLRRR